MKCINSLIQIDLPKYSDVAFRTTGGRKLANFTLRLKSLSGKPRTENIARENERAILSRSDTSSCYCDEITRRSWPLLNARYTSWYSLHKSALLLLLFLLPSSSSPVLKPLREPPPTRLAGKYCARRVFVFVSLASRIVSRNPHTYCVS